MSVSLVTYACDSSPCSEREAVSESDYELFWSLDGSDLEPCDGTVCGDDSGGCGSDPTGTYRIVARRGDRSWETSVAVDDYSCTVGGKSVELLVGDPPPPARCAPLADKTLPTAGTMTWQMGEWGGTIDAAAAAEDGSVQSNLDLWLPELESDDVSASERLLVTSGAGDPFFYITFFLGDLRDADAGTAFVVGLDDDAMVTSVSHACAAEGPCRVSGDQAGATVSVDVAQGGLAPWPDTVTSDYLLRYRINFQTDDLWATGTSLEGCESCIEPLAIAVDFTFERPASAFGLTNEGDCVTE